jgi:GntR family transcriptional regulator, transcriptional repressor for pyruvate dehydrogenase complex
MPPTRVHRVVADLKDRILAGELMPGTKLPSESQLVTDYDVSRTVAREAVSRLQAEGLVETFQGRGSFVLSVPPPSTFTLEAAAIRNQTDVLDMIDFRIGIECEAAALAAARVTPETGQAITEALAALVVSQPERAVQEDFAFHHAIAGATGNRFFLDLIDALGPMMIMLQRTQLEPDESVDAGTPFDRLQREHQAIAAAVMAGDVETARAAMRVHLGNTRRRLAGGS